MRVTASKLSLLEDCRWWARPAAQWTYTTSPAAERGTRFHRAIALYAASDEGIPISVEDDIREEYARAREWFDSLGVKRGSASLYVEVAFAWDPETDTAEILGKDRDYSRANGRLCGTADLVMTTATGAVMVWDYKTGDGSDAGPQLRGLGLMAARALGVESVTVAALEVRSAGVTEVCREELDSFDLALVAGQLAELIAAIPDADPIPGEHCGQKYCSARLHCPVGQTAMAEVVDVIPAESLVRRQEYRITDPIRTAEQAIWTVDVLRLVEAWTKAKRDEIKQRVPPEGWRTEDGRVIKETFAKGVEGFSKDHALLVLKELGATDEQIGRCYYTYDRSNGLKVSGGTTKPRAKRRAA